MKVLKISLLALTVIGLTCWPLVTVARSQDGQVPVGNSLRTPKSAGSVWPKPQTFTQGPTTKTLEWTTFSFAYDGVACPTILSALDRYLEIIFSPPRSLSRPTYSNSIRSVGSDLATLQVSLTGECETWPYLDMDESYQLQVDAENGTGSALLTANSVWGILRGLESFSHLVYVGEDSQHYINSTFIDDFPRFQFRGLLLDTARHFVPVQVLKENLDAMAYNKYNAFHWHIVDDQSFPYQSQAFPDLSSKGAYRPVTHIYSFDEITSIIEYARERGIRVIVEFDTPGHTQSWGLGQPSLLTQCYDANGKPNGFGPINPIVDSSYEFLQTLFNEIANLFPDQYLHLGGDEVSFDCWKSNPDILAFMANMSYGDNFALLESYYINKLLDIVANLQQPKSYIVWQEVFDNGCQLQPDTVVNVWKTTPDYLTEMANVTANGFQAILSSCWYINRISYGSDWVAFYTCEPQAFNGTQQQHDLVMGGSAAMWGEWVDATNLISRTWPRASGVAERLWSARDVNDSNEAAPRLEEHRCRMLGRNINAEPFNGPDFCNFDNLVY